MKNEKNRAKESFLDESLKGCYGSRVKPSEAKKWLVRNIISNINREDKITLNLNSCAGIGKTSIVKSLKKTPVDWNGKHYDGFEVIDIPLAQIEEMGDVLGFPTEEVEMQNGTNKKWVKASDSVIASYIKEGWNVTDNKRTSYAPPEWVPVEEKPGVILFDDGNRASQRIMKGLMQLVQDYRTISWKIPNGWTIVFTGNPDNTFNQVTSMDTAQLTRMKFITPIPDALEWAVWAQDNGIDKRLVSFVLKYPEMMVAGKRTNPRSLAEFGRILTQFPNLSGEEYKECLWEANASLDEDVVSTMMVFIQRDIDLILDEKKILEDYENNGKGQIAKLMKGSDPRTDIVNIVNDRIYAYLVSSSYKFEKSHVKNFQSWILDKNMPEDSAFALVQRLCGKEFKYKMEMFSGNQKLVDLVSKGMSSSEFRL